MLLISWTHFTCTFLISNNHFQSKQCFVFGYINTGIQSTMWTFCPAWFDTRKKYNVWDTGLVDLSTGGQPNENRCCHTFFVFGVSTVIYTCQSIHRIQRNVWQNPFWAPCGLFIIIIVYNQHCLFTGRCELINKSFILCNCENVFIVNWCR